MILSPKPALSCRAKKGISYLFFQKMKDQGCDGAVLGCTEIPLLVDPADCPLPTLDSTRLLARDALRESLKGD